MLICLTVGHTSRRTRQTVGGVYAIAKDTSRRMGLKRNIFFMDHYDFGKRNLSSSRIRN